MASPATSLPTRRLGDSDIEVSLVGLGCNNFGGRLDLAATAAVLDVALGAGVTLFDTADIYGGAGGSERLMGEALEAIAGLAAQAAVGSVIAGATRPEQVAANVAALRWKPSAEDLAELDRVAPTPRG